MCLNRFFRLSPVCAIVITGYLYQIAAHAQQGQSSENIAPKGEQPDYSKTYIPGASDFKNVFELNLAQLANKAIGLEFESRGQDAMNFGLDLLFSQTSVSTDDGNSGLSKSTMVVPKIRLYPMEALKGAFLGAKLFLGQVSSSVTVLDKTSEKSFNVVAPAVHVGYRFLSTFGFTWSLYGGAGVNLPRPKFETKHLSDSSLSADAQDIISKVNDINKEVRIDLGVTAGIAL